MLADPHAAAVVKIALEQNPETPHTGVTAIMALEDQGYRVVTIAQIKQVLDDVARWRTEAERKQTLRAEIEAELCLIDVDPERYMDVALQTIRGMKAHPGMQPDQTQ